MLKKLNLGCGKDYRKNFINLDALESLHPDIVHDLNLPLPFKNGVFNHILAQDILEHFTKEDLPRLIDEIARITKNNGIVEVRVPNLNDIFSRFEADEETRNEFIYGTTKETGIFGVHKIGLTPSLLATLMLRANLEIVSLKTQETNFVARFKKNRSIVNKKSLFYINQTLGLGGAEVFMTDLLVGLKMSGWLVDIGTNYSPFAKMLESEKIPVRKIRTVIDIIGDWKGLVKGILLWPFLMLEYWRQINSRQKPDLILLSGFIEKILVSPLAALKKIPVCWIEFGPMATIFAKFWRLPKILYFLVKGIPQTVITSSNHTKNSLTSEARISLAKLKVIPCGRNFIDVKKVNENNQGKNIVCVSRLEPGKGQDLLIKAFAKLAKKDKDLHLQIVGEGDFLQTLIMLVEKLKLRKQVDFLGRVNDSLAFMKKGTVVVFPSVWPLEGFGMVMIEAMALGKPIVAFNRGPGNEIIEDGKTGLLARNEDINDLAKKMELLITDPELAEKLGDQAKIGFDKKYKIDQIAKQYEDVFEDCVARNKATLLLHTIQNHEQKPTHF